MRDWPTALATTLLVSLVLVATFADWLIALVWGATGVGLLPFELGSAPSSALSSTLVQWLWATRQTVAATSIVILVALPVGAMLGTLAALQPRVFASVLTRAVEFTGALPSLIVLGLWCVGSKSPTMTGFALVVAALRSVQTARVTSEHVRQALAQDFSLAARALGAGSRHLFWWHVWPSLVPVLIVEAAATASYVIVIEASLGFVGLGPEAQLSWGALLGHAREQGDVSLWPAAFLIAATTLALNTVGPRRRRIERRQHARARGFLTQAVEDPR
jgi:peptide/nickel transport system permease protein